MKRAAVVLCGGRSSRMGRAKAWLPWFGGRSMIEHVVDQLGSVVDEVIVVTSADLELPVLPKLARVVTDRDSARGPLAGLRDGLAEATADQAFVTSTDAPFLTEAFVEALFAASGGGAAAPVAEGHVQVLAAVYPTNAWRRAEALLEEGIGRPLSLLEAIGYEPVGGSVGYPAGSAIGAAKESSAESGRAPWRGFNTPAEYLAILRELDPEASVEVELLGRAALKADSPRRRAPVGTLGEVLSVLPASLGLIDGARLAKPHLVSLGGRDLVRDLSVPVGPDERLSVIDALAGG